MRIGGALAVAALSVGAVNGAKRMHELDDSGVQYVKARPQIHGVPDQGWMNDPNGPWYDAEKKLYHMYYQHNPADTIWGNPVVWGHLVSTDLTAWKDEGVALTPPKGSDAYSGSVVIDKDNTSGFFDDSTHPDQRAVAIWTHNTPQAETQWISYSTDGGYSFTHYDANPVLDLNSTQFRDPKVFWHEESKQWILAVVLSQQYRVQFYSSPDLKKWTLESEFDHEGILGFQYECPNLLKVPVRKNELGEYHLTDNSYAVHEREYMWVLIVAINPGGPQGGSFNQYFIGDFDGKKFTPYTHQARFMDFGKDFYAYTSFNNHEFGEDRSIGVAWASNWQYGEYVPTKEWRSSMSLVRELTVKQYSPTAENVQLNLYADPIVNYDALQMQKRTYTNDYEVTSDAFFADLSTAPGEVIAFNMTFACNSSEVVRRNYADLVMLFNGADDEGSLSLGYNSQAAAFYVDRGDSAVPWVKTNPFFTNRLSTNLEVYETLDKTTSVFKVQGFIDGNIIELFFNDGSMTTTNTFFISEENLFDNVEVYSTTDGVYTIKDLSIAKYTVKQ